MGLGTGEDLANIVAKMSRDTIERSIEASTIVAGKAAKLLRLIQ